MQLYNSSSISASQNAAALAKIKTATASAAATVTTGANEGPTATGSKSAKDEFLDYAKLTPAQKLRATILSKLKITEEELKAMPPKERQKIEDQIKEMTKQQVIGADKDQIQKGALVDLRA